MKKKLFLFVKVFTLIFLVGCGSNSLWNFWDDNDSSSNGIVSGIGSIKGVVAVSSNQAGFPNIRAQAATGTTPVPNAEVWLLDLPDIPHAFTNASGVYTFNNIPAGNHEVVASYTTRTANGVLKGKTTPIPVQTSGADSAKAPDIVLNNANKRVKGIFKPTAGTTLPAGTKIRLWGEYFTLNPDGTFISPPLPNDILQAELELIIPGKGITRINTGFTGIEVPTFIEQTINPADDTNHSPSGILIAKNSQGEITGKCNTGDSISFEIQGQDQDPGHADLLSFQWTATNGNLVVATDKKTAQWTTPNNAGVATITVVVTDPQNATSSVSLLMLVGIDSIDQADMTAPVATFKGLETGARTPTLSGTVDDPDSTIQLLVNGKTYQGTVNNNTWSVSVTDELSPGTYTLVLECKDKAGNVSRKTFENALSIAEGPIVDVTKPKVVLSSEASGETATSPIVIKVEFDEIIKGLETTDFTVTNGSVSKLTEVVASKTFSLEIVPGAAGVVTVDLGAAKVTDEAGNENEAASQFSITYKPADQIKPTVEINQKSSQADPTSATSVVFSVTFSEPVKDFTADDLTLSGTANPTTVSITKLDLTADKNITTRADRSGPDTREFYEVTVSNITNYGTIIVSMEAGKVTDLAGNPNEASTSYDNTVSRLDMTPPTFVGHLGANKTGFWKGNRASYYNLHVMAEDSQHNLYMLNHNKPYEIIKIDSAGNFVKTIGTEGSGDGEFLGICDVAVDSNDNLFITENYRISKLDKNGVFISKFGKGNKLSINSSDEVFSADTFKHEIYKYANNGNQLATITLPLNSSNRPFYPGFIDHDSAGNLYVSSDSHFDILKYDAGGNLVSQVTAELTPEHAPMVSAHFRGMRVDSAGNIFVLPRYTTYVVQLNSAGKEIAFFGGKGTADDQFYFRCNEFIISSTGDFVITEENGYSIKIFGSDFQYKKEFCLGGYGPKRFIRPAGLAIDKDDNLYVAESGGYTVEKYSADGTFQLMIGTGEYGTEDNQFQNPVDVVVDNSGNIFVMDMGPKTVKKFDSNGNFLLKFGEQGTGDGHFNQQSYPIDLALDSAGNIYVCENIPEGRIQKFSNDGNFIGVIGKAPWYYPDIIFDKNDNLLVLNDSILKKYDSTGKEIEKFECTGTALALSNNGEIYTVFHQLHSARKYSSSGQGIVSWGTQGTGDGQFNMPYDIACDSNGNIYIADYNNNTIEKYSTK